MKPKQSPQSPFLKLFVFFLTFFIFYSCKEDVEEKENPEIENTAEFVDFYYPELFQRDSIQKDSAALVVSRFAGPELTPSPSTIAVAPTGEVFVGVDMMGSLGKEPGKGSIVKLVDEDNDGKMDFHTEFALVDNPRGILPVGDKLFVLHTTFSPETGKATGMDLVYFQDENGDGIADGPSKPLIQNISSPKFLRERGTDHATNGIRMGIDGWIYIAVGDFGFHGAVDREGTELTMLGGGIVRVRPDGTEMEVYTHGTRNTYDVAIDPFMNIFTRGNTNDGGGWNIRFSHHIQTGEYGYASLFKNFTDEIIPALADLGGGSGTGAYFMSNESWPKEYNNVPMMADWGRSQLYIHRVRPDGATFEQKEEEFFQLPQITDLDVDASGRMYLSAWDGAGYSGSPGKGFVVRAVPEGWEYEPFPDLNNSSTKEVVEFLKSGAAVARLHAQQELLRRPEKSAAEAVWKIATDEGLPLAVRVAGIYTYAQIAGEKGIDRLVSLTEEQVVREFALRALSDRKGHLEQVPIEPFIEGLGDPLDRVKVAAIVGLGRLGRKEAAKELLSIKVPASLQAPAKDSIGAHATPNPDIVPAHLAVQSLVDLNAVDAVVDAIGTENSRLALWALRYMHDPKAVEGLIAAYDKTKDDKLKKEILTTLSRLYKKEAPYDGSWWWGTRPDTKGPYYKAVAWESSPRIAEFLKKEWKQGITAEKEFFTYLNDRHGMGIADFQTKEVEKEEEDVDVDLEKISDQKGQVGKASIEDVLLAMQDIEGSAEKGKEIFQRQGCFACHSVAPDQVMKGPYMGQVGSIMNREQIAESILKPNASISQGFATYLITTKDGKTYNGFITKSSSDETEVTNIAGQKVTINTPDIVERKRLETSMMPAGLVNSLSYEEFASLLTYLSEQKE